MRKITICIILLSLSGYLMPLSAQTDKELASLVNVVKLLRVSTEANFKKATGILSADMKWTPMNETGSVRPEECKPSDRVKGFKLNRILFKAEGSRKYVSTHGDMINGEDARFDYSLYERTLKAKSTVWYCLRGRKGKQTFVIVPFNKSATPDLTVTLAGSAAKGKCDMGAGTITIECNAGTIRNSNEVVLIVENKSSKPQPFVIINHNTRK